MSEYVILVDNNDIEVGTMAKLEAHQKGVLHRAFPFSYLILKGKCYYSKGPSTNIIQVVFGRMPVAVTHYREKIYLTPLKDGLLKKWALQLIFKPFIHLHIM